MLAQAGLKHINEEEAFLAVLEEVEAKLPIGDYDKCIIFFVKDNHDSFSLVSSTMLEETFIYSLNSALTKAVEDAEDNSKSRSFH